MLAIILLDFKKKKRREPLASYLIVSVSARACAFIWVQCTCFLLLLDSLILLSSVSWGSNVTIKIGRGSFQTVLHIQWFQTGLSSVLSISFHFGIWNLISYQTRSVTAFLVAVQGHLHTYRFCDNVWTFILTDATFKSEEIQETLGKVKIVACDSKLLQPQQP